MGSNDGIVVGDGEDFQEGRLEGRLMKTGRQTNRQRYYEMREDQIVTQETIHLSTVAPGWLRRRL